MRQSTLVQEAGWALGGTWRLLLGRREARGYFDDTQRGLAGSFVGLVLACVLLAGFVGVGGRAGVSGPMAIFALGMIMTLRLFALRFVLARLAALDAFRPYMVASNWAGAILLGLAMIATFGSVFGGAWLMGPGSGETLVVIVLALWAVAAMAMVAVEFNIFRIVAGLRSAEIVLVMGAQLFAILAGLTLLGQIVQG